MKTTMETGLSGMKSGFALGEKSGWMLPVALLLGATGVIALLFFSLYQRTEAKFLQMQYLVEDVQSNADEKVRLAQQDVFAMSQKYEEVQQQVDALEKQLSKLDSVDAPDATKQTRPKKGKAGKSGKGKAVRGLEDLRWSGETAITSASDDPTVGFKKGELL